MLTIIHGDDITKSRKYFIDLKQKYPNAASFEAQTITVTDIIQQLEGGELFSEEKAIFLENFISKNKTSSTYKSIVRYLSNPRLASAKIILWENKEIDKATISSFSDSTVRIFKLPQMLYTFLDIIKPDNTNQTLKLFHQTLINMEEEAIFYLLIRHIRLLLALHSESGMTDKSIDEVKRMQSWQLTKLQKQSSQFTLEQLLLIYNKLYDIESAYKTGNLTQSLTRAIDILITDI